MSKNKQIDEHICKALIGGCQTLSKRESEASVTQMTRKVQE